MCIPVTKPASIAVRKEPAGNPYCLAVPASDQSPDVRIASDTASIVGGERWKAASASRSDCAIDLLFSDIGLPGMTGTELAREAQQLRPKLRILLTTGYAQETAIDRAQGEPGILLITKPFGRADLAQKIRNLLASPPPEPAMPKIEPLRKRR